MVTTSRTALIASLIALVGGCRSGPLEPALDAAEPVLGAASGPEQRLHAARWERLPSLLQAVRSPAIAVVRGRIWVLGGADVTNRRITTVQIFDPETQRWSLGPELPVGLDFHTAAVLDDHVHVISGATDAGVQRGHWVLDTCGCGEWSELASIPIETNAAMTQVIDGKIYVFGGTVRLDYRDVVQVYDPATDSWTLGGRLPIGRLSAVASTVDGQVHLVGGGVPIYSTTDQHLIYDRSHEAFELATPYPHIMEAGGGGMVDGVFCVFGGRVATQGRRNTPFADAYCLADEEWVSVPEMPTPRAEMAYVTLGGLIYAIGGDSGLLPSTTTVEALRPFPGGGGR